MPRPARLAITAAAALTCLVLAPGCASPAAIARPSNTTPATHPTTQSVSTTARANGIWRDRPWPYEVLWSATREPAPVAVYVFAFGGTEEKGTLPWLLAAVWPDGRAVWSDDRIEGGRPYRQGRIAPDRVRALTDRLTTLATGAGVPSTFHHVGPDYLRQILQFRTSDGRVYGLGSWHELQEARGGVVMTDHGTFDLRPGQTTEQALREHASEDYRRMRRIWTALRHAIDDALPQAGQPAPEDIIRFEIPKRANE
jgi:hypothetical protein